MYHRTIHENDCGNCKHWHQWDFERECEHWSRINQYGFAQIAHDRDSTHFGDCDRITRGTEFKYTLDDGSEHTATYDGYSFEDECYDDEFHCFEPREDDNE